MERPGLAIVVGMRSEAALFAPLGVPVGVGGGTVSGAEAAAERLVAAGARALLSAGLAGGLDPMLVPGVLVVPRGLRAQGRSFRADPALARMLPGREVTLALGVERPVAAVADKRRLWRETGASIVDLESGAVARVATAHGLPFAVWRAVCDPAARGLPRAALVALDGRGVVAPWRVAGALLAAPRSLPALIALAGDARAARGALRAGVGVVGERLRAGVAG